MLKISQHDAPKPRSNKGESRLDLCLPERPYALQTIKIHGRLCEQRL